MKTNKLLYILAGALLSLCVLASCGTSASSDQETTTETDTGTEIATGATTSAETTAETKEEVTQMPRYDYFEAEVGPDVTLDKSVYASMKLELPKSLLVTDEQVQTYLNYLIFQEREAVNGDTKVYDQPLKLGDTAYIYYRGTVDGAETELTFPIGDIYRLLFGAGEDFEVYVGETIHYFIPDERRSCVEWYMASAILYDLCATEQAKAEAAKEASV